MTSVEQALAIISARAKPFRKESIRLEDALGRILAEDIYADRDYPPFNRACMDGYALMQGDWEKGIRHYLIIEVIFPGQLAQHTLDSGSCYKIMTGAATPAAADMIIRLEDALESAGRVTLQGTTGKAFQNIARRGEDCHAGKLLLSAPSKCTPQIISLLATVGKATLQVFQMPKVALITTGDEVVPPNALIGDFQIRNSNQYLLMALLAQWNIAPVLAAHVIDNREILKTKLAAALSADLVIINGAVSGGEADYVPSVLAELGAETWFHQVSIRPGKPVLVAKKPAGAVVFALPGNPLSCLTTFQVFVEHYLYRCCGFEEQPSLRIPLAADKTKKHALTEYFPVYHGSEGSLNQLPNHGSGDITAVVKASGLALHRAETTHINSNDLTTYYPFNP